VATPDMRCGAELAEGIYVTEFAGTGCVVCVCVCVCAAAK
jgi:hypothetical protein